MLKDVFFIISICIVFKSSADAVTTFLNRAQRYFENGPLEPGC